MSLIDDDDVDHEKNSHSQQMLNKRNYEQKDNDRKCRRRRKIVTNLIEMDKS